MTVPGGDIEKLREASHPIEHAHAPWLRRLLSWLFVSAVLLVGAELCASTILVHADRFRPPARASVDVSPFSVVNLVHRMGVQLGVLQPKRPFETRQSIAPNPFWRVDPVLGRAPIPGRYRAAYERRTPSASAWRKFAFQITINPDGSRWTGAAPDVDGPTIYIFGGSDSFGSGVNDEQTYAALLQQARPGYRVRLFAAGAYGLSEAYINFTRLRHSMRPGDIIIIGYSDTYDIRNVVAPSWLRTLNLLFRRHGWADPYLLPKAEVAPDGAIRITPVQQLCSLNEDYCAQRDPDKSEMTRISAALVNRIGRDAPGPVYLVHLGGSPRNPLFAALDDRVTRVSALPKDFDSFVHDDIAGFDPHPGPYWHYAVSRKLLALVRPRD